MFIQLPDSIDQFGMKQVGGVLARANLIGVVDLNAERFEAKQLEALLVGLLGAGYKFDQFKSKLDQGEDVELRIQVGEEQLVAAKAVMKKVRVVNSRLALARDMANTPANHLTPDILANWARAQCHNLPLDVDVWDETRLAQEKCGAILAVGQGSANPPRLVRIRYGKGPVRLSLVGKGITFDTGGLSLKPADSMLGMKYDMTGAAVALGAILAIAESELPIAVEAVLCLAENMPGPTATRPGDIVTSRSGLTIEVTNTDAEGRLVLADGIDVAAESNPEHLVDIATLTGAATIALGSRFGGLLGFGSTVEAVLQAATDCAERFWQMPLAEDARKMLESSTADIMNAKVGSRAGGMLVGGQFLAEFVKLKKLANWAHLDIANVANNDGAPYEEHPSGPTAYGLRTIVRLAENLSLGQ